MDLPDPGSRHQPLYPNRDIPIHLLQCLLLRASGQSHYTCQKRGKMVEVRTVTPKAHCSQLAYTSRRSKFISGDRHSAARHSARRSPSSLQIQFMYIPNQCSRSSNHSWPIPISLVASAIAIDCTAGADKSKITHHTFCRLATSQAAPALPNTLPNLAVQTSRMPRATYKPSMHTENSAVRWRESKLARA
jgi:hypothetical protein